MECIRVLRPGRRATGNSHDMHTADAMVQSCLLFYSTHAACLSSFSALSHLPTLFFAPMCCCFVACLRCVSLCPCTVVWPARDGLHVVAQ